MASISRGRKDINSFCGSRKEKTKSTSLMLLLRREQEGVANKILEFLKLVNQRGNVEKIGGDRTHAHPGCKDVEVGLHEKLT